MWHENAFEYKSHYLHFKNSKEIIILVGGFCVFFLQFKNNIHMHRLYMLHVSIETWKKHVETRINSSSYLKLSFI